MPRPTTRDAHFNQALTNVSIAYQNANYIAEMVFPIIEVEKKSDYYYIYDSSAFFRNRSGTRAPGTRAPRADYGVTNGTYSCVNDALAYAIPDEVRKNADSPLQPDVDGVNFVADGLMLGLETRVANVITTASNWDYSGSPATQWTNSASNPWDDIMTGINAVVSTIGQMPNTAVISWETWRVLTNHPDFLDRVKYTRPSGIVEPNDIATWFGFEKFLIGTAIKDASKEGETASKASIWGDDMWIGFVPSAPALRTPAAGYTLTWGGKMVNTYREDQEHQDIVEAEWFTDEIVTSSASGALLTNVV